MGFFDFVNSVTDAAQSVVSTVKDGANVLHPLPPARVGLLINPHN